jgi:hypothetical protein
MILQFFPVSFPTPLTLHLSPVSIPAPMILQFSPQYPYTIDTSVFPSVSLIQLYFQFSPVSIPTPILMLYNFINWQCNLKHFYLWTKTEKHKIRCGVSWDVSCLRLQQICGINPWAGVNSECYKGLNSWGDLDKQGRQYTYNATLRPIHEIIITVEKL